MNVVLTDKICKDKSLTWLEKVILGYFAQIQATEGKIDISNDIVFSQFDISKRTLNYTMKLLIDKGYLERKFQGNNMNWRVLSVKHNWGY